MGVINFVMLLDVYLVTIYSLMHFCWGLEGQLKVPNDRPIIGVLSQELSYSLQNSYPDNFTSYVAASYVKFLQGAGARVVPIWINKNVEYYEHIINSVNGVLFPGGSTMLKDTGYGKAGRVIYDLATSVNERGDYFPLWGTCLGFELMTFLAANNKKVTTICSGWDQALPLNFKEGYLESKLFGKAQEDILSLLANENLTANFHHFCVTEKNFIAFGLNEQFKILSISKDSMDRPFISAIEGKLFPFYGVQFHPEKNSYEWNVKEHNIPHSADATHVGQYFAEFFVNEARKNGHKFPSLEQEADSLIYKYSTYYTASKGIAYDECYLFKE